MGRFTRNNAITEGFHTKMEVLERQTYGLRNFQDDRLRIKVLCSCWSGPGGLSPLMTKSPKIKWYAREDSNL